MTMKTLTNELPKKIRLYKIVSANGTVNPTGCDRFTYDLPQRGRPGKWTKRVNRPVLCVRGYHVCSAIDLTDWLMNWGKARVFIAHARDLHGSIFKDKFVCGQIRLANEVYVPRKIRDALRRETRTSFPHSGDQSALIRFCRKLDKLLVPVKDAGKHGKQ